MNRLYGFTLSLLNIIIGVVLTAMSWTILSHTHFKRFAFILGVILVSIGFTLFTASFWYRRSNRSDTNK